MTFYNLFADNLLKISENKEKAYIWFNDSENNVSFGFQHRKDYSGLMAYIKPEYVTIAKDKQGYFDIIGITGNWKNITHDTLIRELLRTSTLHECISIWRGEIPPNVSSVEKRNALASLAILMFEQEVNFGNEVWQRRSRFYPNILKPRYQRPRDLLMGYIVMSFTDGLDAIDSFKNNAGLLLPPSDDQTLNRYFNPLRCDPLAEALMTGKILERFRAAVLRKDINPHKAIYYKTNTSNSI